MSHDFAQKVSSQLNKYLRKTSDFQHNSNISVGITLGAKGPQLGLKGPSPQQELEGRPQIKKFYETDPQKMEFMIQNTILKS